MTPTKAPPAVKTILALDLGTKLGWALSDREAGTIDLSARRNHESSGMRFVRFRTWLREMLDSGIDLVAYEDVRNHKGVEAAHIYGGLVAILQEECLTRRKPVEYVGVGVGAIKRFATGKGNAPKDLMVAAAQRRWPELPIADDNMADSLWLLSYARGEYAHA